MILINNKINSIIKIRITGKNINRFINKIIKYKICILNLKYISRKEIIITVTYDDFIKIKKYKTIYKIEVVDELGLLKVKNTIHNKKYILITLIICVFAITYLSNLVIKIDIIHENKEIKNLVTKELKRNGIEKYSIKKSKKKLEAIKKDILERNKDKLEWIEIIETGTKYTIKIQERIISKNETNNQYQNIISKKNAIIKKIIAQKGEKVRNINDYVTKGDIIINGILEHPDSSKTYLKSEGTVYGETWYIAEISQTLDNTIISYTGKNKSIYKLKLNNKEIDIYNRKKYKYYEGKSKIILSSNYIPIYLIKEKQKEITIKKEMYTEKKAIKKAISTIKKELIKKNQDIKQLTNYKIISIKKINGNKLKIKFFISTLEDITEYSKIKIEQ